MSSYSGLPFQCLEECRIVVRKHAYRMLTVEDAKMNFIIVEIQERIYKFQRIVKIHSSRKIYSPV